MSKIDISVVVPVCNVGRYVGECLDSVLKQTKKEFEVICVDDGSTDNSLEVLRKYERMDSRVKVITKPNAGYGHTMNVGFDAAQGDYIIIVESDDYVSSNMFERLYDTITEYNADVVKSDHFIFSTQNGLDVKEYQAVCPTEYYNRVLNADICPEIFTFTMMNWTGIYKTSFIRENNIRHNETPGASFQDNGFWFQAISMAEKVVFINEAFYHYRQDNPNSSINNKKKVYCICDEYKFMSNILNSHKEFGEEYHKRFLEKKFFNYLNSYRRISDEFKIEFLEHISKEFENDLKDPLICIENFDPWIYKQMNRIIDSPKLFYIEDNAESYRREYNEVHQELMKIRNSKEFKKGLKVKKLLHQTI